MATIYQEEIKSFLELIPESGADALSTSAALNSSLSHRCSNDPVQVREEADMLRQVLFYINPQLVNKIIMDTSVLESGFQPTTTERTLSFSHHSCGLRPAPLLFCTGIQHEKCLFF